MSNNYLLPVRTAVLQHAPAFYRSSLLHDYADRNTYDTDALIASGDYFETLATSLDEISHRLDTAGNQTEHFGLEMLINELLYLQRNYHIVKNILSKK